MPQQNTNPAHLEWITYRPSCGYEHLGDPDMRVCPMICPDGVEPEDPHITPPETGPEPEQYDGPVSDG